MRHFMEQFGPALKWPWSRLTDVPELTDGLLDRIVEQSDAQAAGRSVRELERLRDDCLVAVIQGLRAQRHRRRRGAVGLGAQPVRSAHRRRAARRRRRPDAASPVRDDRPARLDRLQRPRQRQPLPARLRRGHRRAAARASGVDEAYVAAGGSYYTVETHLSHLARRVRGRPSARSRRRSLGVDAKRLHLFHVLERAGEDRPLATAEQMLLHVDAAAQRTRAGATGDRRRASRAIAARARGAATPRARRARASERSTRGRHERPAPEHPARGRATSSPRRRSARTATA